MLACLMLLTAGRKESAIERAESLAIKAEGLIELGYEDPSVYETSSSTHPFIEVPTSRIYIPRQTP